jgi:hypothetical protein
MSWLRLFDEYLYWIMAISSAVFVAGLIGMRFAIIAMPADYFVSERARFDGWFSRHPAARWMLLILKNLTGYVCLVLGAIMLLTPGPGIVMLLMGLSLINFPVKRRLECWLAQLPGIRRQIDVVRMQHGRPPLQFPQRSEPPL